MTDLWPRLEPLLAAAERPARYLNHEFGCVYKPEADFRFCMVYPDTYELGQANQALRILVNVVNAVDGMAAERAFLPAPGEAKPDWWIVAQIAKRLGHGDAFAWQHPHEIFCEHAALTAFENDGTRALNLHDLAELTREAWERLEPYQWSTGDFPRRNLVPVDPVQHGAAVSTLYPVILNTGRIRDQWHTMTRTGYVSRLMQHIAEPMVEVAPQDAVRYQLPADGLARIWSRHGVMVAKVAISEGQRPGSLFVPMHWNNQFARQGRVNNLLAAVTDPYSGQPESKQAAVAIAASRNMAGMRRTGSAR